MPVAGVLMNWSKEGGGQAGGRLLQGEHAWPSAGRKEGRRQAVAGRECMAKCKEEGREEAGCCRARVLRRCASVASRLNNRR
eukprot:352390-Chlamydomonas_euryale.AAC.1